MANQAGWSKIILLPAFDRLSRSRRNGRKSVAHESLLSSPELFFHDYQELSLLFVGKNFILAIFELCSVSFQCFRKKEERGGICKREQQGESSDCDIESLGERDREYSKSPEKKIYYSKEEGGILLMSKTKNTIILIVFVSLASFALFSFAKAETLKIGFATDWEYGSRKEDTHKLPRSAKKYLKVAVNHYNNIFHPDLAIGGGDYILGRGVSKKKAKKQMIEINRVFSRLDAPRRYCIGNHDLGHLSKEEVQENLGINYNHSVTDTKGARIITLDTNDLASGEDEYETNGRVSDEELAWLNKQLDTNLPVIVFSHHSPVQTPERNEWRINILDAGAVRTVLEKYGNVVAVFSGHHAVNYSEKKNGINYFIINNLTDSKARGSFADISVETDEESGEVEISVTQYGKKPASYKASRQISQ